MPKKATLKESKIFVYGDDSLLNLAFAINEFVGDHDKGLEDGRVCLQITLAIVPAPIDEATERAKYA